MLRTLTPLTGSARAPPINGVRADCASQEDSKKRYLPSDARGSTAPIDAEFDDNFFDVVYAGHALDRLIDLKENIAELKRIIKRDGILLLTLPNIGSLCSRIFKERFRLLYSNHLVYFTPQTLERFFAEVGCKIVEIKYPFYRTSFFSWSALSGNIGKIMLQCCFYLVRVKTKLTSPLFLGKYYECYY